MKSPHRCLLALSLAVGSTFLETDALAQSFPRFSNPTNITNPYFPVSNNKQSITLGTDEGLPFRSEETLLPTTRTITWAGGTTRTRIVQFAAYLDGDLVEIAYDYFAQSDNGTVYYFGEDVYNYEDGVVVNTDGTWLAGRDGAPPGVIMRARPAVGQVFHPENFRPLVWEEDTVVSLTEPTRTPQGAINNGLLIHELLLDDSEELKVYAFGFGQVEGREDGANSNLVMLNRVNAPIGEVPSELDRIESRADDIFRAVPDWTRVSVYVSRISNTWRSYRPQAVRDGAPSAFINAVGPLITRLRTASAAHDVTATLTAAGDLRAAAIDLTDYYNPMIPADVKRLDLLERELKLSARRGDWVEAAILQAKAADVVWGRLRPVVLLRAGGVVLADEIDAFVAAQAAAVAAQNANDAIDAAWGVIEVVDDVEEIF